MSPQQKCDLLFERLADGNITLAEYARRIDAVVAAMSPDDLKDLDKRRDGRSPGEFAGDIFVSTRHEAAQMAAWQAVSGWGDVAVRDHGIANDGRLVLDTGGRSGKPDFLVWDGSDWYPVELKPAPHGGCLTLKLHDANNYLGRDDLLLLVVVGKPPGSWALLDHDALRRWLRVGEHGHHDGFGGKPTVRIFPRQYAAVFGGLVPWSVPAVAA